MFQLTRSKFMVVLTNMWWRQWWKYPIIHVKIVNIKADLSEKCYKMFLSTETVLVLRLVAQVCCNLSVFDSVWLQQMKPIRVSFWEHVPHRCLIYIVYSFL